MVKKTGIYSQVQRKFLSKNKSLAFLYIVDMTLFEIFNALSCFPANANFFTHFSTLVDNLSPLHV